LLQFCQADLPAIEYRAQPPMQEKKETFLKKLVFLTAALADLSVPFFTVL
jgi:hypothetical protein